MTDSPQDPILQTLLARIVERFHPRRVILFGSRARDAAGPGSDVDLLVVFDQVRDKRRTAIELRREVSDLAIAKDFVVTTPEEIVERGSVVGSVLNAALKEGRVLYEAA